jgi:F0F1-type ATP synthase membrane subunit c/vacuolar-type H+-ATPase subunit K
MTPIPADSLRLRVVLILWGALFISTCMFILVLVIQQRSGVLPTEPVNPIMLPVFGVVALAIAVTSVVFPRHMHRSLLKAAKLEILTEVDERGGPVLFRDAAPTIRVFADSAKARDVAFPRFQTPFILGMALSESVALFGFTLGFLGFPLPHVLPFWGVCWVLMIMRFPTRKRIYGPLEELHDAVIK